MVQDTAADASLPAATRSDAVIPVTPAVTTTTTPLPPTTSTPPPDSSATSTNDHPAIRPASPEARPDERHENKERTVREGDDRDRQSRELRAGLHPLQVSLSVSLSLYLCFSPSVLACYSNGLCNGRHLSVDFRVFVLLSFVTVT
jgi:hypothetical protein